MNNTARVSKRLIDVSAACSRARYWTGIPIPGDSIYPAFDSKTDYQARWALRSRNVA